MFLDKYLNESNDMLSLSMTPFLSESDMNELKNIVDSEDCEHITECCFTDDYIETMLLLEVFELLEEEKIKSVTQRIKNKFLNKIEKFDNKIKHYYDTKEIKNTIAVCEKLEKIILANTDKIPTDYVVDTKGKHFYPYDNVDVHLYSCRKLMWNLDSSKMVDDLTSDRVYKILGFKDEKHYLDVNNKAGNIDNVKLDKKEALIVVKNNSFKEWIKKFDEEKETIKELRDKIVDEEKSSYVVPRGNHVLYIEIMKMLNQVELKLRQNLQFFNFLYNDLKRAIDENK